jgi:two-component system, response regulator YesN
MEFGEGIKVLIVDDEYIIRERLELNLRKTGFNVVGQAETGLQAYELYKKTKPDIIISDIFMPVMNGAELLEKIRKNDSRVKFIFLTGYSEFDYAMSALKNNASDYLLKPLDTSKLIDVLQKLVDEIEEEKEKESLKRENILIKDGSYIDHFFSSNDIHPDMNEELASFLQYPDGTRMLMIYTKRNWIESDENVYQIDNDIKLVFFSIYGKSIKELCTQDCYAAMGAPCHSEKELRESFHFLRRVLLYRFFSPDKHFYIGEDYLKVDKDKIQAIDQQNRNLLQKNKITEIIELIEIELIELKSPADLEYYLYLMKGLLLRKSENILGVMLSDHSPIWILEQFTTLSEFANWLKALIQKTYLANNERAELDLSTRIKQYLEENYASSINLNSIAVNVFAHPNYISTKFKEDVGVSVTEYLCSLRLERAKELLNTTNLSCKKVSQIVGFQDQFYFGKCFKKRFKLSPTAFQKAT